METVFGTAFEYKLIYVFAINDEAHNGLLKIGDTSIGVQGVQTRLKRNVRFESK